MDSRLAALIEATSDSTQSDAWVDIALLFDVSNAIPPDCGASALECLPDQLKDIRLTTEEREELARIALAAVCGPTTPDAAAVWVVEKAGCENAVEPLTMLLRAVCSQPELEGVANATIRALVVLTAHEPDKRVMDAFFYVLQNGAIEIRESVSQWMSNFIDLNSDAGM